MSHKTIIVATPYSSDLDRWQQVLSDTGDLRIVAHAPGLMELFNKVEHGPPNIVLVAAELCTADEFELIVTLFDALDVRWIKFTSLEGSASGLNAPANRSNTSGLFHASLSDNPSALVGQVRSLANAQQRAERPAPQKMGRTGRRFKRMVLIGASTGGVDALKTVLSQFGPDCPPTVVLQHTSPGFGAGLCRVLDRASGAHVRLYEPDVALQSGTIFVVAGLPEHVVLTADKRPHLQSSPAGLISGHRPSIDKLFSSSLPFASRIVACVLTGMGADGAKGLLDLREAGARTLSQDRETSVVYGMPGAAWSNGGSMRQVPLHEMGDSLLKEATL
ncbi:CheB methylesterase domain-containing protein [Sulfitobacter sp. HNIBRBA2951]|uniref:CheB methylesterase domain-containing protein n=1 Tax=Sulfitobacter aquimarinus TaxID=3158557 RepID=UPI0032DF3D4A